MRGEIGTMVLRSDVDFARLEESFSAAVHSYAEEAYVQQTMAEKLAEIAASLALAASGAAAHTNAKPLRVLEIGSGPGNFTLCLLQRLQSSGLNSLDLTCNDLSQPMLARTQKEVRSWLHKSEAAQAQALRWRGVQGNVLEDSVQARLLEGGPFALMVSNAVFQWFPHLGAALCKMRELLQDGGFVAFSSFAAGTLRELKALLGEEHGLKYLSPDEIKAAVAESGLKLVHFESFSVQHFFASARLALRHLKHTGVNALNRDVLTVPKMRALLRRFEERFGGPEGVSLTWHPYVVVAQKQ